MKLSVACGDYDITRRLLDGTIGIDDHRLTLATFPPEEMFRRAFEAAEFDISELSVSLFMQRIGQGTCPYIGIPVFPSRAFRHSAIYVRTDGEIRAPVDLRGRKIGVRTYLNTAALVVRGLLADRYGIAAGEMHWLVGDVDRIERDTLPIPRLLRPVDIQAAPSGVLLSDMLMAGEIDTLIHYTPPRELSQDRPRIKRLFADPGRSEREYFQSTGIFPIMHLIGIRRSLVEEHAPLARQVCEAFALARNAAIVDSGSDAPPSASPQWPYGIPKNRSALDSLTRYAFEQGLTDRQLSLDDLFVSNLLDE